MNASTVDRGELRAAARRHFRPGITAHQAIVLAFAELTGQPLDPEGFDESALLLRAERLVLDGLRVSEALATARTEFATWAIPRGRT